MVPGLDQDPDLGLGPGRSIDHADFAVPFWGTSIGAGASLEARYRDSFGLELDVIASGGSVIGTLTTPDLESRGSVDNGLSSSYSALEVAPMLEAIFPLGSRQRSRVRFELLALLGPHFVVPLGSTDADDDTYRTSFHVTPKTSLLFTAGVTAAASLSLPRRRTLRIPFGLRYGLNPLISGRSDRVALLADPDDATRIESVEYEVKWQSRVTVFFGFTVEL